MKLKKLLCIAALLSTLLFNALTLHADDPTVSYYQIRSQGVNLARDLAGMANHLYQYDMGKVYGTFSITPEYSRSFRSGSINKCLFADAVQGSCCDTLVISGSRAETRGAKDLLADYFYLPTDFQSSVHFSPRIENAIVDLGLFVGLDEYLDGLYFKLHAPITWTRWNLNMCESVGAAGVNGYEPGYFTESQANVANGVIPREALLTQFTSFIQGGKISEIPNAATTSNTAEVISGITVNSLHYALMSPCAKTDVGIADFRAYLGWNHLAENYHVGFNVQIAAPTGNRPNALYLFQPIVGNGHHWEVGGALSGHYDFWRNKTNDSHAGVYAETNITHIFKSRQKRTFDLKGKGLSRYALAMKLGTPVENNLQGGATAATSQFKNVFTPVANLTTMDVNVSVGVQADFVVMFNYTRKGLSADLGYNLWAKSCEKIEKDCKCVSRLETEANTWALKGDAHVIGFANQAVAAGGGFPAIAQNAPIRLSATNSAATIHGGTNFASGVAVAAAILNPSIDNPQLATAGNAAGTMLDATPAGGNQINTSIQSVFLSASDIDLCETKTRGISHKLFGHLSYSWEGDCYHPFIGIGAEGEFGNGSNCCSTSSCKTDCKTDCSIDGKTTDCSTCINCAVSQWGVWIKGGVSF